MMKVKVEKIDFIYNLLKDIKNKDYFKCSKKNNLIYESLFKSLILEIMCLLDIKSNYCILDKDEILIAKEIYKKKYINNNEKLSKLVFIYRKIKTWRDKVVAHCDKDYLGYQGKLHSIDIDFVLTFMKNKLKK